MKLFWKIFSIVFFLFIIVVCLFSFFTSARQISDAQKHTSEEILTIGTFLGREIELGYLQAKWPFEGLKEVSKHTGFLFWWIVRDDGVIHLANEVSLIGTLSSSRFPEIKKVTNQELFFNYKKNYSVFVMPLEMGNKTWWLWLGFSLKHIVEIKKRSVLFTLVVSLSAIMVMGVLLFFAIRYFIAPIKILTVGAEIVGSGDLSYRVKVDTKDELGELASSFNKMAQDLDKTTVSRDELAKEIEERKKTEEELKRQKDFIQKALDSFNIPFYVINRDYTIALANEAAKNKGIVEGGYCYQLTHRQQKPCEGENACPLQEVPRTGKSVRMEHLHCDKKGNKAVVELYGFPLFDQNGQIVQMIELNYDITERKKAEDALKAYAKKIEEINKELDDFTYIVSHDLKEPLRSIDAFSKFVADDYKDKLDEEGRGYIERIRVNASRMQNLIEDLLEISRIERKKNLLEEVESAEFVNDAKLRLEFALKQKNVEIIVDGTLPSIFCDRVRMQEVFFNLISNAVKFSDKPNPRVEIGVRTTDGYYEFYVKDNGPGIEEEYFEKIFEIFQRLGKIEEHEGTGAGLTIAKKIVQMHKGKIWVESKVGEGTTFHFTLPKDKKVILGKKKIGEILIDKKVLTEEQLREALDEQEKTD